LGNSTYDQFTADYKHAIVMFHSLYSQNCKEAREQFSSLSERYYGVDHVGLGAVDCHRQPEQGLVCYHLTIRKYPSYKYYKNGKFILDVPAEKPQDVATFLDWKLREADNIQPDESINRDEL